MERFQKPEQFEKNNEKYRLALEDVNHITDKLGRGIDEDIKDTIAILKAMDFHTDSSCAGHASDEEHLGFPYVRFYTPAPEGWRDDPKKQEQWKESNLLQRQKFIPLLTEFNSTRDINSNALLRMRDIGLYAAFNIQSSGIEGNWESKKEVMDAVRLYQKEMDDFTSFLKDKFLSKRTEQ